MSAAPGKSVLVVIRHPPYGSSLGRSGLDTALATAAFDQPVDLLFLGDGVLSLQPGQDSAVLGLKNSGRLLASLPLYDIERVYADARAVERYAMVADEFPVTTELLDSRGIQALLNDHDHLLGF